jgi:hypothetical protein
LSCGLDRDATVMLSGIALGRIKGPERFSPPLCSMGGLRPKCGDRVVWSTLHLSPILATAGTIVISYSRRRPCGHGIEMEVPGRIKDGAVSPRPRTTITVGTVAMPHQVYGLLEAVVSLQPEAMLGWNVLDDAWRYRPGQPVAEESQWRCP